MAKLKSCFSKELTNYIETGTTKRDIFKKKLNKEIRRIKEEDMADTEGTTNGGVGYICPQCKEDM